MAGLIIMYIFHVLIHARNAHMIPINLNTIFDTHIEQSPTKTVYIKYYMEQNPTHTYAFIHTHVHTRIHTHTRMHTHTCMHTHTHTHAHTHMHAHICTHTHTHTQVK